MVCYSLPDRNHLILRSTPLPESFPPFLLTLYHTTECILFLERRDRDGDALDWTSGPPSRRRRGNGALLRTGGVAGGTAPPGLGLSAVLRGGGQPSALY